MEADAVEPHARALADAIEGALAGWVLRCVRDAAVAAGADPAQFDPAQFDPATVASGPESNPGDLAGLAVRARQAGEQARRDIAPRVRQLLEQDIDSQPANPLQVLRGAVRYPTEVLIEAGISPPQRDADQQRLLPEDPYDLAPARFADIDPALADLGIAWGAAKAYEHLRRRSRTGADSQPDTGDGPGPGRGSGRGSTSQGDDR